MLNSAINQTAWILKKYAYSISISCSLIHQKISCSLPKYIYIYQYHVMSTPLRWLTLLTKLVTKTDWWPKNKEKERERKKMYCEPNEGYT